MTLNELARKELSFSKKAVITYPNCGIVTAGDGPYFPGIQLLYTSMVHTHTGLRMHAFDMGWTDEQREWAARQPLLSVSPMPRTPIRHPQPKWQNFNKPFCLRKTSFDLSVWMDPDCLIKQDLNPLIRYIQDKPFIVSNTICSPNDRRIYDYITGCSTRERWSLSSGVFGWMKGRPLDETILETWCNLILFILTHPHKLDKYLSGGDEPVLRIVVQKLDIIKEVWWDVRWNAIVQTRHPNVRSALTDYHRNRADDYISHFYGTPKPWDGDKVDVLELNPHEDP